MPQDTPELITEPCFEVLHEAINCLDRRHAPCPDDLRRATGLPIGEVIEHLRLLKRLRLVKVRTADGTPIVVSVDHVRMFHVKVMPSTGPLAASRFSHMALVEGVA